MKKSILCLLAALTGGNVVAEPIIENAFYPMEKIPAELTANVLPGKDIDFRLEENGTTGYLWNATYDPKICRVKLEHKGAEDTKIVGAPGLVEIEIKPLSNAPCRVTLNYIRPFEPHEKPAKTGKCVVTPGVAVSQETKVIAEKPSENASQQEKMEQSIKSETEEIPELYDGTYFNLARVPSTLQATVLLGKDIEFELEEDPANKMLWSIVKYDSKLCRVKLKHDAPDDAFEKPKAEIDIDALTAGDTVVELVYGAGTEKAKTLRIHLKFVAQNLGQ